MDSSNFHAILLSLFILDALRQGTHQTAIAYSSIGISPPWGSPTAAIFGCDGFITLDFWLDGSIIIPSAYHRRHWNCLSMSESWRPVKVFAHVACPYRTTEGMYPMCWYLIFKEQDLFSKNRKQAKGLFIPSPVSSLRS